VSENGGEGEWVVVEDFEEEWLKKEDERCWCS
jgi:hypothetical protein